MIDVRDLRRNLSRVRQTIESARPRETIGASTTWRR